jgi:uncharacterized repeat protein (TIGR03803 family)
VIQATGGSFYGTTTGGGALNQGTVFKIDSAGTLTTLHSFTDQPDMERLRGRHQLPHLPEPLWNGFVRADYQHEVHERHQRRSEERHEVLLTK